MMQGFGWRRSKRYADVFVVRFHRRYYFRAPARPRHDRFGDPVARTRRRELVAVRESSPRFFFRVQITFI